MGRAARLIPLDEGRRRLVESCLPMARMLAGRFAGGRAAADAEELHSVATEALVDAACRFDPGLGVRFATFAYKTIQYKLMDASRSIGRGRAGPLALDEADAAVDHSAGPTERIEAAEAFESLCRKLPRRLAGVVRLGYRDGLTQRQIAARMGVSQGFVSQLQRQAIGILREELSR